MNNSIKSGFLLIDKPCGVSSYACINHLKRILKQKIKIGHAGTLDPFASGLLIVAIGREATRCISQVMTMEKTYVATGKCGELTDTLDCTGKILCSIPTPITPTQITDALSFFGNAYEQTPPLYSALKHQGIPLYALARKAHVEVDQLQHIAKSKSRTVQLYMLELIDCQLPFFTIKTCVSKGTYIRTLINDIATHAGSYATTYELTRTAIGSFLLANAIKLYDIHTIDDINKNIIVPFMVS